MAKRGLSCPCFLRIGWEGLQGGSGLGRPKMKHEKGVRYFMVPKSGVGMVWEGQK